MNIHCIIKRAVTKKIYSGLLMSLIGLLTISCSKTEVTYESNNANLPTLPSSWFHKPENTKSTNLEVEISDQVDPRIELSVEGLIKNQLAGIEGMDSSLSKKPESIDHSSPVANSQRDTKKKEPEQRKPLEPRDPLEPPKPLKPWRLEFLETDLSISSKGVIGQLIMRGTPAISLFWKRLGLDESKKNLNLEPSEIEPIEDANEHSDIVLNDFSTPIELENQIEPLIKSGLATGRIKNKLNFKAKLLEKAKQFRDQVKGLAGNPGLAWWVSRLRMDVQFDAAGNIPYATSFTAGAGVKVRLEWHRVNSKHSSDLKLSDKPGPNKKNALRELIVSVAEDLSSIADEHSDKTRNLSSFKAYQFRVGLGVSARGDIGLAKAGRELTFQAYFTRERSKAVKPTPIKEENANSKISSASPKTLQNTSFTNLETYNFIDNSASPSELAFADSIGVKYTQSPIESTTKSAQTVYKINRTKFRKGLGKSMKMANFFIKHANAANGLKWKVYELRTALDLSLSGSSSFSLVTGSVVSEIMFYNTKF